MEARNVPLLEIKDLHTYFYTDEGLIRAVEGLDFKVQRNEIVGLVGESACGKSVSGLSVMRLIQPPGKIVKGAVIFEGQDLLRLKAEQMRRIRGGEIAMIFQEPGSNLNPLYNVGFQVGEMIKAHTKGISKSDTRSLVLDLLKKVEIADPESRINDYPHTLSGGQAQRVLIATALACNPKLIIADEPTTALDVTVQAQIMDLFLRLKEESMFSLILITHDVMLCSRVCQRIVVMYAGRVVEEAPAKDLFQRPLHPYTRALLSSVPHGRKDKQRFKVIEGVVPDPAAKPVGCHFHPRCLLADASCKKAYPEFREVKPGHRVSCFKMK
ncbi:ABC transporter ATP-binding protein [Candidatus Omnitrophota bacterium]